MRVRHVVILQIVVVVVICVVVVFLQWPTWVALLAYALVLTIGTLVGRRAIRRERRTSPPAPVDVRLHRATGEVIPIELVYTGMVNGVHVWTNPHAVTVSNGDHLRAGVLPRNTAIAFKTTDPHVP